MSFRNRERDRTTSISLSRATVKTGGILRTIYSNQRRYNRPNTGSLRQSYWILSLIVWSTELLMDYLERIRSARIGAYRQVHNFLGFGFDPGQQLIWIRNIFSHYFQKFSQHLNSSRLYIFTSGQLGLP